MSLDEMGGTTVYRRTFANDAVPVGMATCRLTQWQSCELRFGRPARQPGELTPVCGGWSGKQPVMRPAALHAPLWSWSLGPGCRRKHACASSDAATGTTSQ